MKKIIPFIAILFQLLSCQKTDENPYHFNFEEEMYLHYYVFMYSSTIGTDCWDYSPMQYSPTPYYYEERITLEVKRRNDSDEIQIFKNGELFIKGKFLLENEEFIEFEIENQTVSFNTLNTTIMGGYDGKCETYFDGRIYKDRSAEYDLEINFRFTDTYKGQDNTFIMVSMR